MKEPKKVGWSKQVNNRKCRNQKNNILGIHKIKKIGDKYFRRYASSRINNKINNTDVKIHVRDYIIIENCKNRICNFLYVQRERTEEFLCQEEGIPQDPEGRNCTSY